MNEAIVLVRELSDVFQKGEGDPLPLPQLRSLVADWPDTPNTAVLKAAAIQTEAYLLSQGRYVTDFKIIRKPARPIDDCGGDSLVRFLNSQAKKEYPASLGFRIQANGRWYGAFLWDDSGIEEPLRLFEDGKRRQSREDRIKAIAIGRPWLRVSSQTDESGKSVRVYEPDTYERISADYPDVEKVTV